MDKNTDIASPSNHPRTQKKIPQEHLDQMKIETDSLYTIFVKLVLQNKKGTDDELVHRCRKRHTG